MRKLRLELSEVVVTDGERRDKVLSNATRQFEAPGARDIDAAIAEVTRAADAVQSGDVAATLNVYLDQDGVGPRPVLHRKLLTTRAALDSLGSLWAA